MFFFKILKKWVKGYPYYTLKEDETYPLFTLKGIKYSGSFCNIQDDLLTIKKGYSWNGCSPKISFFDAVLGTPEGVNNKEGVSKTRTPSLVHDCLYTIKLTTRKEADEVFLELLRKENFKFSYVYYFVVRIFGKKSWGQG